MIVDRDMWEGWLKSAPGWAPSPSAPSTGTPPSPICSPPSIISPSWAPPPPNGACGYKNLCNGGQRRPSATNLGLKTRDSKLGTQNLGLKTWDSKPKLHDSPHRKFITSVEFCNMLEGMVPQDMRDSKIIALYRNKGARLDCKNHRGISLFGNAGKACARVILPRL